MRITFWGALVLLSGVGCATDPAAPRDNASGPRPDVPSDVQASGDADAPHTAELTDLGRSEASDPDERVALQDTTRPDGPSASETSAGELDQGGHDGHGDGAARDHAQPGDLADLPGEWSPDSAVPADAVGPDVPGVDWVELPDAFDPDAPLSSLDALGCFELCSWLDGSFPPPGGLAGPCIGLDACLSLCAVVPQLTTRPCGLNLTEFATCMAKGRQTECEAFDGLLDYPECFPIGRCLLPDDPVPLVNTEHRAMRVLCNHYRLASGDPVGDPRLRPWSACVFGLQAFACACDEALFDPASQRPGCDVTVGDTLACIEAAGPAGLPALPGCVPFAEEPAASYALADPLVQLGCAQVRQACQDAIPEQGNLPESPTCRPETGQPPADYRAAVETCVASVGSLRCHCAGNPAGPGCAGRVEDLRNCVAESYVEGCAYLAEGACIAPQNGPSGIAARVIVAEADDALLADWCAWRVCMAGGPGFAGHGCPDAAFATRVPDVAGCVADLRAHFATCDVTLADVEACILTFQRNDACERLSTFGACTGAVNTANAYIACHYMYFPQCDPVVDCLAAVFDIPLEPPGGY